MRDMQEVIDRGGGMIHLPREVGHKIVRTLYMLNRLVY